MSCYGLHRYGPPRNGRRRCERCGHEDPPAWAWWAREPDQPDTQPSLFGDAA